MSWSRREVLATLGVASANAILFACGAPARRVQRVAEIDPEIRTWLEEAVAIMVGAGASAPHALAVARRRTTAAIDVLGAGVARGRCDGVVLSVRDKAGFRREHVTNNLSRDGVLVAVRALLGVGTQTRLRTASVDFGAAPPAVDLYVPDPVALGDGQMLARAAALAARDKGVSSRIVYSASSLDIDDSHVWSVAPGRVAEQRLVRVRRALTRVAWHGTRPFVSEAVRGWTGGVDAQDLSDDEVIATRENALALLTPRAFEDGAYGFLLEPGVAAALIDAGLRTLLTPAQRTSESITIVDDPTVRDAYGAYRFDDAGALARPVTVVERGQPSAAAVATLRERVLRPGHVGRAGTLPGHLRLLPGTVAADALLDNGFVLEGHATTLLDPTSDRFVIQVARAREQLNGRRTGRMFADIEIVGELSKMLGSIRELSKETRTIAMRDEIDRQPRHRSIETPWLFGSGQLRQLRRLA